jgi:GMP synthase-like glutamine amidotransferase
MAIGLLLCDHLDPEVVDALADYTELYPQVLGPVGIELRIYEVTRGELPGAVDECDGWIVSGSRRSAYEDEGWIHAVGVFIREVVAAQRPLLGVCFGHQLIALSLGGEVVPAEAGWGVGTKSFDVVAGAPWLDPHVDRFRILMSHKDQVQRLPEGAEVLATATYCPVGAYRIGDHVFCVQGHPEFVPELSRLLIERRRGVLGDEVADAGLASLDEPVDRELMAGWIARFFAR